MFNIRIPLLLGFTMVASAALAKEAPNIWTSDDVKTMCDGRWQNQPSAVKSCVARNQRKIGKERTPGEIQELDALKDIEEPKTTAPKH